MEKFIFEDGKGKRIESDSLVLAGFDQVEVARWAELHVYKEGAGGRALVFSRGETKDYGVMDAEARERIEKQQQILRDRGIEVNVAEQVAASGTRMASDGYTTQEQRKREHERKMPARDAAEALIATIDGEKRREHEVSAAELGEAIVCNGKIGLRDGATVYALSEQAIRGICARLESPALRYLLGARDRMIHHSARAKLARGALASEPDPDKRASFERTVAEVGNLNDGDRKMMTAVLKYELKRKPEERMVLRLRDGLQDCFAVLSCGYKPADANAALPPVLSSIPEDARATWAYDEKSTTWELRASIWTPTPTNEQAIGEPFEGWVSYSSRDNGTSKFRGGGGVTLIRCYNASTYEARAKDTSRVHRSGILLDVEKMTAGALAAIDALCVAWGRARSEELTVPSVPIEAAIPGFWRACLTDTRQLAGILRGRKDTHVEKLTEAYFSERRDRERIVRSDFAQGWTRYIQDEDGDVRREAERAMGRFMVEDRPMRCELEPALTE